MGYTEQGPFNAEQVKQAADTAESEKTQRAEELSDFFGYVSVDASNFAQGMREIGVAPTEIAHQLTTGHKAGLWGLRRTTIDNPHAVWIINPDAYMEGRTNEYANSSEGSSLVSIYYHSLAVSDEGKLCNVTQSQSRDGKFYLSSYITEPSEELVKLCGIDRNSSLDEAYAWWKNGLASKAAVCVKTATQF